MDEHELAVLEQRFRDADEEHGFIAEHKLSRLLATYLTSEDRDEDSSEPTGLIWLDERGGLLFMDRTPESLWVAPEDVTGFVAAMQMAYTQWLSDPDVQAQLLG